MTLTFIEIENFMACREEYFPSDDAFSALQNALLADPESGSVMRGCGGLRVSYQLIPELEMAVFVDVYDKDEADDLTQEERKILADLAATSCDGLFALAAQTKEKMMNAPEVEIKPKRPRFFERVQTGLLQTIAYAQGEAEARVTTLTLPDPPPAYDAERIRALRTGLGFSQPYFSRILNVSPKTVQSWEQGVRVPSQSSARLLQLIENPHLLDSLREQQNSSQERAGH